MNFHGGETAGYNSFMGYDPTNQVTLVVWTNLAVPLDGFTTANDLTVKVLDQIYVDSPLAPSTSPTDARYTPRTRQLLDGFCAHLPVCTSAEPELLTRRT